MAKAHPGYDPHSLFAAIGSNAMFAYSDSLLLGGTKLELSLLRSLDALQEQEGKLIHDLGCVRDEATWLLAAEQIGETMPDVLCFGKIREIADPKHYVEVNG